MRYTALNMLERLKGKSKIVSRIVDFQKTFYYPIAFALLGAISSGFGDYVYVPAIYIMAISTVFSALFCDDLKVLLVPIVFVYYSIGCDVNISDGFLSRNNVFGEFSTFGLVNLIVCGCIMLAAVGYRLYKEGVFGDAIRKKGMFTTSFLVLIVVFMFNGAFSSKWEPMLILIGFVEGLAMMLVYVMAIGISDRSEGVLNYAAKLIFLLGAMIFVELLISCGKLAVNGNLFDFDEETGKFVGIIKTNAAFAWGDTNITGALLAISVIVALYLSYTSKRGALYMAAASVMYLTVVFVNGRCAILFGGIFVLFAGIPCLISGKDKKRCRIYFAAFVGVLAAVLGITVLVIGADEFGWYFYKIFRLESPDSGRFSMWANGMEDFLSAPVFGVGFLDGGHSGDFRLGNFYSNMYHNIFVELLGGVGIVGALAFLYHFRKVMEVFLRRFSMEKAIVCFIPLLILAMSTFDNFFWYSNFQIVYGLFLGLAEVCLEKERLKRIDDIKPVKREKPRVVFTCVEAGKGHISPIMAVSGAFKKKYGDDFEVVVSHFYSDSTDDKLLKFENGFKTAVELQNKYKSVGALCQLGNFLVGDALAQRFLMQMTPKGLASYKAATERLKSLDADLLFTAHWGTAYYSQKLNAHPYTMMLCPDAFSNGMFNIDCNELLICTDDGLNEAEKNRLYAGGNLTRVPFPVNGDALRCENERLKLKEKYDVKDSFVITLSDGGYGMANLEKTVTLLAKSKQNLLVFALCGTNKKLYEKLKGLKTSDTVRVVAVSFTDKVCEYLAVSDLFIGKSGANSMAEPAFFGVPVIITKCITYIERNIKKYYVKKGGAMYIPNVKKAVKAVETFATYRETLKPYADNMKKLHDDFDAEKIADLIYERICDLKTRDNN